MPSAGGITQVTTPGSPASPPLSSRLALVRLPEPSLTRRNNCRLRWIDPSLTERLPCLQMVRRLYIKQDLHCFTCLFCQEPDGLLRRLQPFMMFPLRFHYASVTVPPYLIRRGQGQPVAEGVIRLSAVRMIS